jgi:hypothetical protein
MELGEPTVTPVLVTAVESRAWAIPKSMTFGPVGVRRIQRPFAEAM